MIKGDSFCVTEHHTTQKAHGNVINLIVATLKKHDFLTFHHFYASHIKDMTQRAH